MCPSTSKLGCPHGTWMMLKGLGCIPRCSILGSHRYGGSISIFISTGYISLFFIYIFVSKYIYIHIWVSLSININKYIYIHPSLSGEKAKYPIG